MHTRLRILFFAVFLVSPVSLWGQDSLKVLFIRGGSGSGGFFEGGSLEERDEQLADITNFETFNGNHGWGELATLLRSEGFSLDQVLEGAGGDSPLDLINLDLDPYALVVFGSNNARYEALAVNHWLDYIERGGGALFISDANFGGDWDDASNSDNDFVSRIGWEINQDRGTYDLTDFEVPSHPILDSVDRFGGEGVSPITLVDSLVPGVQSTILVRVPGGQNVGRLSGDGSRGPATSSTAQDAVLIVAEVGQGRVAGFFDRNTFFNENGAGFRDLNRFDHAKFAANLFNWLGEGGGPAPPVNLAPTVSFIEPADSSMLGPEDTLRVSASALDTDGVITEVSLFLDDALVRSIPAPPYTWGPETKDSALLNLGSGSYRLTLEARDDGGYSTQVSRLIFIDRTPLSIHFPEPGTFPTGISVVPYPNPVLDYLQMEGLNPKTRALLYDSQGKELPLLWDGKRWNFKALEAGVYYLQLERQVYRVVKE